jgi:hypothetical protein
MTVITKLSDRDNLIFDAIKMILVNQGPMEPKDLQWKLFECGIYIKGPLLKHALAVMNEKGELTKPDVQPVQEKSEA